jgi:arylsulfatase A-like enzyme
VLWVHLTDAHEPYRLHAGFPDTLPGRYESEVAHSDAVLAPLLERLRDDGHRRSTVVFFGADHGEEFDEHGYNNHGHTVYEPGIQVPFALRVPGAQPKLLDEPVSFVDLAPTFYDLVGVHPKVLFAGRNLTDLIYGRSVAIEPRAIYTELLPYPPFPVRVRAVREGPWKLIHHVQRNVWELYHLEADPGERDNLVDERSEIAARLRETLQQTVDWIAVHR